MLAYIHVCWSVYYHDNVVTVNSYDGLYDVC